MPHKISLLIRAVVDREAIELIATGCLTEQTLDVLLQQVRRAWTLGPASPVLVDVTGTQHIDRAALDTLRRLAEGAPAEGVPPGLLRLAAPEVLPACPLTAGHDAEGDPAATSEHPADAADEARWAGLRRPGSRILRRVPDRTPH